MTASLAATCLGAHAQAQTAPLDSVTLFGGHAAKHNLLQLPAAITRGEVQWEPSFFTALALRRRLGTLVENGSLLDGSPLERMEHGIEIVLAEHNGLQHSGELGASYTLRTAQWELGALTLAFGGGIGLSHAFGTSSYEDGPVSEPTRRYPTQLLLLFDIDWSLQPWHGLSLVTRVHHRSGAYGLIAPRHVGSNFLALGLRSEF